MRPIKFRAWNKKVKVMSVEVDLFHGLEEWEREETEIMQFTGLHDKNGKEIYEGDILSSGKIIHTGFVEYQTLNERNYPINGYIINAKGDWLTIYPENTEVIGNIHENPNLIN